MQQLRARQFHVVTNDHSEDGPGLLHRLANAWTMVRARLGLDSGYITWND